MPGSRSAREGITVGVISDTHGLVRPEALRALKGADLIIHAGDVGAPDVLAALGRIAPVFAVRGNNDRGSWAHALPHQRIVEAGESRLFVVHDIADLDVDPAAEGLHAVITGHSHVPRVERRGGVLFLNTGSAGPRRFRLPIALVRMRVRSEKLSARITELC